MKIINPTVEIMSPIRPDLLQFIEQCGRVCYKSEDKITEDSAEKFVAMIIKNGHESVLEHYSITVKFIVDRGISHEIVRHRIGSYNQESTRYCNYGNKEIEFISPYVQGSLGQDLFKCAVEEAEQDYKHLIENGDTPQMARSILPNALKTEIICTYNLREWRHVLKLRCSYNAHPQMRQVMIRILRYFKAHMPVIFSDIPEGPECKLPIADME